jgi:hypothetical protein
MASARPKRDAVPEFGHRGRGRLCIPAGEGG